MHIQKKAGGDNKQRKRCTYNRNFLCSSFTAWMTSIWRPNSKLMIVYRNVHGWVDGAKEHSFHKNATRQPLAKSCAEDGEI
jgi:hypothetical protein